jgi:hypothetical protein
MVWVMRPVLLGHIFSDPFGGGNMPAATIMKYSPLGFFITVFATYQGARNGMPWLGFILFMVTLLVFLPFSPLKKERIYLTLIVGAAGFIVDSALIAAGVYHANEGSRWLIPHWFCPEWILTLWLNFGFALFVFKPFLSRNRITPVIVGIVFAMLIYANASRMGLVTLQSPKILPLGVIAASFAVFIPLCTWLANKICGGRYVSEHP